MATLIGASIDLTKIDKSKIVNHQNGSKYLNITIAVNDESNDWGKNVSLYHEQNETERTTKEKKNYVGNGKVFWTDGVVKKGEKKESNLGEPVKANGIGSDNDDLPF